MIHIIITKRDDQYVATYGLGEYVGASPDEALGYALREMLLRRGVQRTDGSIVMMDYFRVTLLQE